MFDIGFLEILVVLIIALIVIGPERMPEVARKIGQFTSKVKRFVNSMKEDSEITSAVRELQDSMNIEDEKRHLEEVTDSLQDDFSQMQEEWGIDEEISRPTFGGSEPAPHTGTQFNKAPAQPELPLKAEEDESAVIEAPEKQASATEDKPKTEKETTPSV